MFTDSLDFKKIQKSLKKQFLCKRTAPQEIMQPNEEIEVEKPSDDEEEDEAAASSGIVQSNGEAFD